jgi:large subunit ribosomal protein L17
MRHRKSGVKLNRTTSHRQAMFRNMVTSLLKYNRIKTTEAKAKELRRWADHIVTLAKRGNLHARRQAMAIVREKDVVHKIFEEAQDRFGAISGGYTRIVKIGRRPGDAAPLTIIELVSSDDITPAPSKKAKPVADEKAVVTETQPASSDTPVDDAVDESVSEAAVEAKDADAADDSATLDATDDSTGKEKTKDVDNSAETEK